MLVYSKCYLLNIIIHICLHTSLYSPLLTKYFYMHSLSLHHPYYLHLLQVREQTEKLTYCL